LKWLCLQWDTLQHTATHCNTLQHTATHCNTLQHTASFVFEMAVSTVGGGVDCNTLQHTATHCNKLQLLCLQWVVGSMRLTPNLFSKGLYSKKSFFFLFIRAFSPPFLEGPFFLCVSNKDCLSRWISFFFLCICV